MTEDYMERHTNEGHQPDECKRGMKSAKQRWTDWSGEYGLPKCASHWKD